MFLAVLHKMNKKGTSLALETIIIAIIILVVIALVIIFIIKYGGSVSNMLVDQANTSASLIPKTNAP